MLTSPTRSIRSESSWIPSSWRNQEEEARSRVEKPQSSTNTFNTRYVSKMIQDFLQKTQKPMKYELDASTAGSLHIFRGQELDRFNKLVVVIEKSLKQLQLAIDG
jgi:hypothetical protein